MNYIYSEIPEVLTEVLLKIQFFGDVTPSQWVDNYRRFQRTVVGSYSESSSAPSKGR